MAEYGRRDEDRIDVGKILKTAGLVAVGTAAAIWGVNKGRGIAFKSMSTGLADIVKDSGTSALESSIAKKALQGLSKSQIHPVTALSHLVDKTLYCQAS